MSIGEEAKIHGFVRFNLLRPRSESKVIKIKSITFDYGECDGIDPYPITFHSWREANGWIFAISPGNVVYYKTWFTIEYENGQKFKGRYDIQGKLSDVPEIADLGASIRKRCLHGIKSTQESIYKELLDHYEIRAYTL